MWAVGCWKTPAYGTPSRLQTMVLKDFLLGLQIRRGGHELFWFCVGAAGRRRRICNLGMRFKTPAGTNSGTIGCIVMRNY